MFRALILTSYHKLPIVSCHLRPLCGSLLSLRLFPFQHDVTCIPSLYPSLSSFPFVLDGVSLYSPGNSQIPLYWHFRRSHPANIFPFCISLTPYFVFIHSFSLNCSRISSIHHDPLSTKIVCVYFCRIKLFSFVIA